jgi:hypothetical protein
MIHCNICNREFTRNSNFVNHRFSCDTFKTNKTNILSEYYNGSSYHELSKKYGIDRNTLSLLFTSGGVEKVDDSFFSKIDTPEKAWLLGVLAADGCVKRKNRIALSQSGYSGYRLIVYVKKLLNLRNKITNYKPKNGNEVYAISVVSDKLTNDLKKYNIVPKKSLSYEFPSEIPSQYLKDFVRGYVEGDGCICFYKRKNGYRGLTVSMVGTEPFIKKMATMLPISPSIYPLKTSPVWILSCHGEKSILLCEWMFSSETLYTSYKYKTFMDYKNYIREKNNLK